MAAPAVSAPQRGLRQAVQAFAYREFRIFWSGALLSNIGTWMQNVTVPYVLYRQTGSALWVGIAAFMQFIPGVALGPVAGWMADRFDRRLVLLATQGASAVLALVMWALFAAGRATPLIIVLLVAAGGVCWGVSVATWQAFVTELVPRDALLNAITLSSAQFNGARAIGPALGGLILGPFGPSWAFLVNAISYVAVLAALLAVRPDQSQRQHSSGRVLAQFHQGLTYVRKHPGIVLAIGLVSAVGFLGSPVFQLATVLAARVFHVGAGDYGVLTGALGGGGVLGAALLGTVGSRYRRSTLVSVSFVFYGLALAGVGLSPNFGVGVVCMALAGVGFLVTVATLQTSVQMLVAETFRGRALAVYVMVFTGAYPLGALLQGWLADAIGVRATIVSAAALVLLVGVLLVLRPRLARHLDEHTHRAKLLLVPDPVAAA
ncbi:MAG TPA: MFS transporter [Acidimicrobiales bacterium]|nr:MFS transporter [Acidimicrobiales bacterium]